MSGMLLSRQEKVKTLVFNYDPAGERAIPCDHAIHVLQSQI